MGLIQVCNHTLFLLCSLKSDEVVFIVNCVLTVPHVIKLLGKCNKE